jgi:hypothetical protein
MLLIVVDGQFVLFVVNVICEDFVWFILIFHLSNHSCRRSRCCWTFCDAHAGSLSIARRAVSSAKVAIVVLSVVGKSYAKFNLHLKLFLLLISALNRGHSDELE